jgi:hypothetical protein
LKLWTFTSSTTSILKLANNINLTDIYTQSMANSYTFGSTMEITNLPANINVHLLSSSTFSFILGPTIPSGTINFNYIYS